MPPGSGTTARSRPRIRPQGEGEANGNSLLPELGNPYSPEKVKQLFEDARNVQNVLDERAKVQDELLNRY